MKKQITIPVILVLVGVFVVAYFLLYKDTSSPFSYRDCNVAGIIFHGDLYTYYDSETQEISDAASAEDLVYLIELAESLDNIKAILLEIDSYGGSPVAAEEVSNTLNLVTKPTVAQIREAGDSAAYWVASAADYIFASALSEVGSIGITQSYLDESRFNQKEGFTFNKLSTGKFKDLGNPEKELTAEERALVERDLNIMYEAFVKTVAENRNLDKEKVMALADGSVMLGEMAKENGLIDQIGGINEVKNYLGEIIGAEPVICWQ